MNAPPGTPESFRSSSPCTTRRRSCMPPSSTCASGSSPGRGRTRSFSPENGSSDRTVAIGQELRRSLSRGTVRLSGRAELRQGAEAGDPRRAAEHRHLRRDRPLRRRLLIRARELLGEGGRSRDRLEAHRRRGRARPGCATRRASRIPACSASLLGFPRHRHARPQGVPAARSSTSSRLPRRQGRVRERARRSAPTAAASRCARSRSGVIEKRPPSINLFKRVPNVLKNLYRLTLSVRGGG